MIWQCRLASDEQNHLHFRLLRVEALGLGDKFGSFGRIAALLKDYVQPGSGPPHSLCAFECLLADEGFLSFEEQLQIILKADPSDATASNDLGYLWADQNAIWTKPSG